MVDDGGIALNLTINGQVAAIACVGDFLVLENLDRSHDGINSSTASL